MSRPWYKREVFWHLVFWISYLLIRVFIIRLYPGSVGHRVVMELVELPLKAAALYFAIYILVGKLLLGKKYWLFGGSFVLYISTTLILNRLEDYYITYPLIEDSISNYETVSKNLDATFLQSSITRHEDGLWNLSAAFLNLIYIYPVVGLGAAALFAKGWFETNLKNEKAQHETLQTELKLLREQLHPHFLFNTLNNIYSLSQAQSEKTPEMILRLSHLLEYMLYEGMKTLVPLEQELSALRDYAELERLRLGDRLTFSFTVEGMTENSVIAPLLLFPFLENCFKHGCHKVVGDAWIDFKMHVADGSAIFKIQNSIPRNVPVQTETQGIGLRNINRRLELIYPGKHDLKIIRNPDSYLVELKLELL
jgi:two-component system LytT family sensor kinase